ncbi:MAG: T9SS type A sorting domain-containing protein [Saprospiraceae bacterium]|nr:T9SS type A sorting domain-containing protein [Saprospiraceae bacterium]
MKTLYTLFFGLYSFCAAAQYCGPLHVHPGATGAGTGESWQDAFVHLQDALDAAQPGAQIWVAAGVYLPQKDTTGNATPANDRSKTFFINKDIQLYGGFAGAEQELSQRDPAANPAILSGDLGTTGVATDNAYHVLWLALVSPLCIIDGFTITRGNANASDVNGTGGGILLRHQPLQYAAPVIQNCIIEHNHATTGGGFYTATDSWAGPSVSIEHCKFRNNTASSGGGIYFQQSMVAEVGLQLTNVEFSDQSIGQYGGGLYANGHFTARDCRFENNSSNRGAGANLEGGTAILENCAFIGNTSLRNGGGLRMERTTATVVNCLFLGNEANILNESSTTSNAGGGMFYRGSNTSFAKLANCVFSGNKGQNGAGFAQTTTVLNTSSAELDNCTFAGNNGASAVARLQGNLTIENSIIFGNEGTALTGGTARSCIIEGGYAGTDNVSVDPLFVALPSFLLAPTAAGNLKLQSGSPAIDQGDNALTPTGFITDADGNHRMINCTIDRGAFEFGTSGASDRICYADADGDGLGNAAMPRLACNTCPGGFVSNNGDCDDSNSAITHTLPPPAAIQLTTEFCWGEPSITLRSIQSATPGRLVWVLVQAPPGSRFEGQEPLEFHPGAVNAEFSTGTDNLLMCSTPSHQNTSVNGVWMFETYYETAAGCRSAVQQGFSITVRQTSTTQLSATACNSYTFNGQTYTQSGIYTQMLTNAEGCDSLFTLHLEIVSPPALQFDVQHPSCADSGNGQATVAAAQGAPPFNYLWSNGQTTPVAIGLTTGLYTVTLTDANGCISIDTVTLTPQYQLLSSFTVMGTPVCHGDSTAAVTVSPMGGAAPFEYQWLHGPQTASLSGLPAGIYHVTITDANGCTATGATIFTDPPLLDISIVQNNHILTSQELDVEYQWINCDTGLPIQDAVNQSFEAIESGRYAVILSRGVCRDTSLCIEIMLVSAAEQRSALPKAEAYPNPNNGRFVLRMPVSGQIALYDATGRLLRTEVHGAGEHTLFIDGPAGLYWLAVMYNQGVQTLRIIRQ